MFRIGVIATKSPGACSAQFYFFLRDLLGCFKDTVCFFVSVGLHVILSNERKRKWQMHPHAFCTLHFSMIFYEQLPTH